MSDRKDYLKKWRQENKEHIRNYKKEYAKTHDSSFKKLQDKYKQLQQENQELKDNWNKLKKYLINDINNRNGNRVVEYEDGRKASETISPIYTLMEDKSKTIKKVLDKMQEIEQKVVE